MNLKRIVVDLGQCDPDHASIKRVVEPLGVTVVRAHSGADVKRLLAEGGVVLVLVSRILDADGSDGMAIVKEVVDDMAVPVMLVSNHAEYQKKAVDIGAVPGFGKAALRDPATIQIIRNALG